MVNHHLLQRVETMRFGGTKLYRQATSSSTIDQISYYGTMKQICTIVEVTVSLDTNVTARTSYKKEIYMELVEALRVLYPKYKYKIIPLVVGALECYNLFSGVELSMRSFFVIGSNTRVTKAKSNRTV